MLRLVRPFCVKISQRGQSDSLFLEALDQVRTNRLDKDPEVHRRPSDVISKLTQQETEITRNLFHRLSENAMTPEQFEAVRNHNIDPYWDPFENVHETREKLVADFNEFSALVTAAEAKRANIQVRKSLMVHKKRYDSLSNNFRKFLMRPLSDPVPKPHRILEQFWDKSALQIQLNREKITWRDADILQQFRAPNGYILPRRVTMLSKKKHKEMTKALKIAQSMAVVPLRCNARDYQTVPIMDPMQFMVDRLTKRVQMSLDKEKHDYVKTELEKKISAERAIAMLKVMMTEVSPDLNYSEFIKLQARLAQD